MICLSAMMALGLFAAEVADKTNAAPTEPKPLQDWEIMGFLAALRDYSVETRFEALKRLNQRTFTNAELVRIVGRTLTNHEIRFKVSGLDALAMTGRATHEVASQVAALLKDNNDTVRMRVAYALGRMREAAPELAALLKDTIRLTAWDAPLEDPLEDPGRAMRSFAANALADMGEAAKAVAPQVAALLIDKDNEVRSRLVHALGKMGVRAKDVAPQVAALLKDPDTAVRSSAAEALENMGPMSNTAVLRRLLVASYFYADTKHARRLNAYCLFGHSVEDARCIAWLGDRASNELPDISLLKKAEIKSVQ